MTLYFRFTPSTVLPLLLPSFLEQVQQVSFFYFHVWLKIHSSFSLSFSLSLCPPLSHWYPSLEKIHFPSWPSFLLSEYYSPIYINKILLMSLSEETTGGKRDKEVREWKILNNPPIYEYTVMHCIVSC
jgi:hypothetical protein